MNEITRVQRIERSSIPASAMHRKSSYGCAMSGCALLLQSEVRKQLRIHGETDYEHCLMDHSGVAGIPLSFRRWHETGHTARCANEDGIAESDTVARAVHPVHRRLRSAGRARLDP